jgi:hypothetical protein
VTPSDSAPGGIIRYSTFGPWQPDTGPASKWSKLYECHVIPCYVATMIRTAGMGMSLSRQLRR